jgi:bifunctional non-homologous end joining protein LigD
MERTVQRGTGEDCVEDLEVWACWTRRFGPIVDALDIDVSVSSTANLSSSKTIGQISRSCRPTSRNGRKDRLALYLFDILFLDGRDLHNAPLVQRKEVLEGLCRKLRSPVFYSQHFDVDAAELFESAGRYARDLYRLR